MTASGNACPAEGGGALLQEQGQLAQELAANGCAGPPCAGIIGIGEFTWRVSSASDQRQAVAMSSAAANLFREGYQGSGQTWQNSSRMHVCCW